MNPIGALIIGTAWGFFAGNPDARYMALTQLQKLSGMAIDGLNKQGGGYAKKDATDKHPEQEQPDEQNRRRGVSCDCRECCQSVDQLRKPSVQ